MIKRSLNGLRKVATLEACDSGKICGRRGDAGFATCRHCSFRKLARRADAKSETVVRNRTAPAPSLRDKRGNQRQRIYLEAKFAAEAVNISPVKGSPRLAEPTPSKLSKHGIHPSSR